MSESDPATGESAVLAQRERLDRLLSAVRIARIYQHAERLYEPADAVLFMLSPQAVFQDQVPIDIVAQSSDGAQRVEQILGRLEYGLAQTRGSRLG